MNIRDPHSKYSHGLLAHVDHEDKFQHHGHGPKAEGAERGQGNAAMKSFAEALSALGESDPGQFAGVLTAIAGELRAAAAQSRGNSSGELDPLALGLEGAASPKELSESGYPAAPQAAALDGEVKELTSTPLGLEPEATSPQGHDVNGPRHHGRPGDPRGSEALLSKILDAVSSALAKVATDSSAGTVIVESLDGVTTTTTEMNAPLEPSPAESSTAA